jgi:hypothetical protein
MPKTRDAPSAALIPKPIQNNRRQEGSRGQQGRVRANASKPSLPKPAVRIGRDGGIVLKNPEIRFFENQAEMPYWPDF